MSTKTNNEMIMEVIGKMNKSLEIDGNPMDLILSLMEFDTILKQCSTEEKIQALEEIIVVVKQMEEKIGFDIGSSERMTQMLNDVKEGRATLETDTDKDCCGGCCKKQKDEKQVVVRINSYRDVIEVIVETQIDLEELEYILDKATDGDIRRDVNSLRGSGDGLFFLGKEGKDVVLNVKNWGLNEQGYELLGDAIAYCLKN